MAEDEKQIKTSSNTPTKQGFELRDDRRPYPVEYHEAEDFLELTIEELFQEPVYIFDQMPTDYVPVESEPRDIGIEDEYVSEDEFLDLSFEELFNQPLDLKLEMEMREKQEDDGSNILSVNRDLSQQFGVSDSGGLKLGEGLGDLFGENDETIGIDSLARNEFIPTFNLTQVGAFAFARGNVNVTFVPNTGAEDNDPNNGIVSFREAVEAAIQQNLATGIPSVVQFNNAIFLDQGSITIPSGVDLTIESNGNSISAQNLSRVFEVEPGGTLTLKNLEIFEGFTTGDGGAIYNNGGVINIENVGFFNNDADGNGGVIYNLNGDINMIGVTAQNNTAGLNGGFIASENNDLDIVNSLIKFNAADGEGAAIYSRNSDVNIANSSIYSNQGGNVINSGEPVIVSDNSNITLFSTLIGNNNYSRLSSNLEGGLTLKGTGFASLGYNIIDNLTGSDLVAKDMTDLFGVATDSFLAGPNLILFDGIQVDAGSNPLNILFDVSGTPREIGIIDIGAEESVYNVASSPFIEVANPNDGFRGEAILLALDPFNLPNDLDLTLREAIFLANNYPGIDTIQIQPNTYFINLTGPNEDFGKTGDLDIRDHIEFIGLNNVTFDVEEGTAFDRMFDVHGTLLVSFDALGDSYINFRGAQISEEFNGLNGDGAFIRMDSGQLFVTSADFGFGVADRGGAIYLGSSVEASFTATYLIFNQAEYGGAVFREGTTNPTFDVVFNRSILFGNTADFGGAIYAEGGNFQTIRSSFANNEAEYGGALYYKNDLSLAVYNDFSSTFSNNLAYLDGGAIYVTDQGVVRLVNDTIAQNEAFGFGDGIFATNTGSALLNASLIIQNGEYDLYSPQAADGSFLGEFATLGYNVVNTSFSNFADNALLTDIILSSGDAPFTLADVGLQDAVFAFGNFSEGTLQVVHFLNIDSAVRDLGDPRVTTSDQLGTGRFGLPDVGAIEIAPAPLGFLEVTRLDDGFRGTQDLIDLAFSADPDAIVNANLSLREAIFLANIIPGFDTIQLVSGTYILDIAGDLEATIADVRASLGDLGQTGDLDIVGDIEIIGLGSDQTTILQTTGADRIFQIGNGATVRLGELSIEGGSTTYGGAIFKDFGNLFFNDFPSTGLTIQNNTADYGGAIYLTGAGGGAEIYYTQLYNNTALGSGGAIYQESGFTRLLVEGSPIDGNQALGTSMVPNPEGAIRDGTLGSGGALFLGGQSTIQRSTFSNNYSLLAGGAVFFQNALYDPGAPFNERLFVQNSTFSGNSTDGQGGAIYLSLGEINIETSTLTLNEAQVAGSGIYSDPNNSGFIEIFGNIIAQNILNGTIDVSDLSGGRYITLGTGFEGPFPFSGYNVLGDVSTATTLNITQGFLSDDLNFVPGTNDLINQDALLAPLADNGFFVFGQPFDIGILTHAIGADSPALNNVPFGFTFEDQRGVQVEDIKDAGAYEFIVPPVTIQNFSDGFRGEVFLNQVDLGNLPQDLTLREALWLAQNRGGSKAIQLLAGTYELSILGADEDLGVTGDLDIFTDGIQIFGAGANLTTIEAVNGFGDRVLDFGGNNFDPFSLNYLIANFGVSGGDVTNTNNTAGGGIYIAPSFVAIDGVKVFGNTAQFGGGLAADLGAFVNISASTFDSNIATVAGGGIFQEPISNFVEPFTGGIGISRSTISNNQAFEGGGVYFVSGNLDVSTISGNLASYGGGVVVYTTNLQQFDLNPVFISGNTITNNVAAFEGGGVATTSTLGFADDSIAILEFSILADNLAGFGISDDWYNPSPFETIFLGPSNLIGNTDGAAYIDFFGNSLLNTAPLLGPLADNGGPTFTHGLLAGSPAIDAIGFLMFREDQRFFFDPNEIADIGAFELQDGEVILPPIVLDLDGDGVELISVNDSGVNMLLGNNVVYQIGWAAADDGFLVYDANGDGKASNLDEIMLSNYHEDAVTDLDGLKLAFDTNQDGVFDANDAEFSKFGVWQDLNSDGVSDAGEFTTLTERQIDRILLEAETVDDNNGGNEIYAIGKYVLESGEEYEFADVGLGTKTILAVEEIIIDDSQLSDLEQILNSGSDSATAPTSDAYDSTSLSSAYYSEDPSINQDLNQPSQDNLI